MIIHGIVRYKDGKKETFRVNGYTGSGDLPAARAAAEGMYRNVQCVLFDVPRVPLNFRITTDA